VHAGLLERRPCVVLLRALGKQEPAPLPPGLQRGSQFLARVSAVSFAVEVLVVPPLVRFGLTVGIVVDPATRFVAG